MASEFEGTRVKAVTVVSWITSILSITVWLGWAALSNRLDAIESGKVVPMAETTRLRFEQFDRARTRIEQQFDRHDERLDALESRIRAIEARNHAASN